MVLNITVIQDINIHFIADEFRGKIDWDIKQIRILTIDIECESENGFP